MSINSPAFYSVQYASAVELLAQQRQPKIWQLFTPMTAEGKSATVVDQIGEATATERTTRYAPIVPGSIPHTRPWVFPRFFDTAELFDNIDKMKMNANPESQYVQALVAAMHRKMDDEAVRAFFADRLIGENGTTTDSFAAAKQVTVSIGGATSGLNVEKLQAGLEELKESEVDLDQEQVYCVIAPKQERNLMNEIEVTSGDFTRSMVMESGRIKRFLGIEFVISNRLAVDGSSYRRVPLFTRAGMSACTWGGGMQTDVSIRKDLAGMPWQAYVQGNFGAVRREAAKVIEIQCAE